MRPRSFVTYLLTAALVGALMLVGAIVTDSREATLSFKDDVLWTWHANRAPK